MLRWRPLKWSNKRTETFDGEILMVRAVQAASGGQSRVDTDVGIWLQSQLPLICSHLSVCWCCWLVFLSRCVLGLVCILERLLIKRFLFFFLYFPALIFSPCWATSCNNAFCSAIFFLSFRHWKWNAFLMPLRNKVRNLHFSSSRVKKTVLTQYNEQKKKKSRKCAYRHWLSACPKRIQLSERMQLAKCTRGTRGHGCRTYVDLAWRSSAGGKPPPSSDCNEAWIRRI